jgi:hypothetical protein
MIDQTPLERMITVAEPEWTQTREEFSAGPEAAALQHCVDSESTTPIATD